MDPLPKSQSSLLRLLMILEWVLLSIVASAQVLLTLRQAMPISLLIVNGVGLGIFAALGRGTPRRKRSKQIYTLIEFLLIFGLVFLSNIPLPKMLFVVLVIRNCLLWDGYQRARVTGFACLGAFITLTYNVFFNQNSPISLPSDTAIIIWVDAFFGIGLVILFLHLLVDAALKEQQGQEKLAVANTRLRQYALRVEELATVQERNRIARDLHDSLGHSLTVFGIHLEGALRLLQSNPTKATELLMEIKHLNTNTLKEVRESITALRSDPLQERTLANAITDLITEFQKTTGVVPTFDNQLMSALSHDLNIVIYRIVQESLTNICKYATATAVTIAIIQSATNLEITITDNGKGFDLTQNTTGFGLQGMQERALALMGQLKIVTAPHQGCCVMATFPLSERIADDRL